MSDKETSPYGVTYDSASNTVNLNNVKDGWLSIISAGNNLTINVTGDRKLGYFHIEGFGHSASVRFTGNGTLTIDNWEKSYGVITPDARIEASFAEGCIMVEKGVGLKLLCPLVIQCSVIENAFIVDGEDRIHGRVTSEKVEPVNDTSPWVIESLIGEMAEVPAVYKTVVAPEGGMDYVLVVPQ